MRYDFTLPRLSFSSTILVCKRRIVDLFPKLERAVENIKTAEAAVMQMQLKRQKEFWYLLKIACVSIYTSGTTGNIVSYQ